MVFDNTNSVLYSLCDALLDKYDLKSYNDFDINVLDYLCIMADEGEKALQKNSKLSAFDVAANMTTYIVAERPINNPIPNRFFGGVFDNVENHQNAMLAYAYGVSILHDAKITRSNGDMVVLSNPIAVSSHSYKYIIEALARVKPIDDKKIVRVLYEQLAYRFNPDASY